MAVVSKKNIVIVEGGVSVGTDPTLVPVDVKKISELESGEAGRIFNQSGRAVLVSFEDTIVAQNKRELLFGPGWDLPLSDLTHNARSYNVAVTIEGKTYTVHVSPKTA